MKDVRVKNLICEVLQSTKWCLLLDYCAYGSRCPGQGVKQGVLFPDLQNLLGLRDEVQINK